jgi:two-component system, OmpR family, sensor kinase
VFRSLRSKLVFSYGIVILLCLILAGSAFVYLLRGYQRQIKLNQLGDLALPITWQVRLLERAGASPDQMASYLQDRAAEQGIRILLVDPNGVVLTDTSTSMIGQKVQAFSDWQSQKDGSNELDHVTIVQSDAQGLVFISASGRQASPPTDRFVNGVSNYSVVLAVPEQSLTASWLELAPSLSFAALVSLIVSIFVAFLLSRSISKPIAAITRASEEMARGNYAQNIRVTTRDEVGRLAQAFNHMAREVDISHRTLRDFLANVSHELRTPLTSIQGFSQAMVDGTAKSPEDYGDAAEIINEESARMRRLVEDLLLLSKIESGQMPMDTDNMDLRELLRACVRRITAQTQQAEVAVVLDAEEPAPMVGDEGRLEQLFRNLLDNALKHTPQGGEIAVRLDVNYPPRIVGAAKNGAVSATRQIVVTVRNSGSYIPPEDQERIFERFYQVDKSRARNGEGSGLGLAIAKEIANAHGATISASSDAASGTTFSVVFNGQSVPSVAKNGHTERSDAHRAS